MPWDRVEKADPLTVVRSSTGSPSTRQSPGLRASDFKLRSIDLYITSTCNRRCTYCFLTDDFLDSKQQMSLQMVQSILDWACASGAIDEVTLLGGEPALHSQFPHILDAVKESGLGARTVTNGSRRFRQALAVEGAKTRFKRVAVSLDAPTQSMFDQVRGPRAFSDAIETVEELKRIGVPFDINCTVLRSTAGTTREMIDFAEELGAERLNMHWFSLAGRGRHHAPGEVLTASEWHEKVLVPVRAYQSPRTDYVVDCELGYAFGLPGEDVSACAVRERTNLQFFPDSSVFACGMLVEEKGRNGYSWDGAQLLKSRSDSECSQVASLSHDGCPLRAKDGDIAPLCIYNRLSR
jgi:molybdenum cofactor biosynthesis enzyme MoaA